MSKGYVYILTNEAMPGLVKIGKTTRDVDGRANELYQTGVPMPFHVAHFVGTPDCHTLEARVHEHLPDKRINGSREFFQCETGLAIDMLNALHREQLEEWVCEFADGLCVVEEPFFLDDSAFHLLADIVGENVFEVVQALHHLTPEEITIALARMREAREQTAQMVRAHISGLRVVGE